MNLTLEQISSAALGAAYITEEADGIRAHRFTPAQEAVYSRRESSMGLRASFSSGIALCFSTDSAVLGVKGSFGPAWTRQYCSLDVTVNGRYIGSADNFSHLTLPEGDYSQIPCPRGPFEKTFDLGSGEKTVKVYFPWSAELSLQELTLSDGSSFVPVRPERKILFYGDSITQGYDALRPMNRYAARVADALGMEEVNKAVGGEEFFADLTAAAEDMDPALVIVAWGTNDWGIGSREHLLEHAPKVFRDLRQKYPDAPLYAIVPIWRGDRDEIRPYGAFAQMRADVGRIAEEAGAVCIDGYELISHDPQFFGDLRLHPSDEGFRVYAENVLKFINK